MCIRIYILISKNKLTIKKNKNIRKAEETKEEKRKSRLNKSGRPGEDISRYPHFGKEEYFFFLALSKTSFFFHRRFIERKHAEGI